MSQKDYEAIAAIIRKYHQYGDPQLVIELADYFYADNNRFKRDKFYRAAGFPELADN